MASALRLTVLFLVATAFAVPAAAESRKLLQQVNVPITVQCVNILTNDQILNLSNLNVGVIQLILSLLGAGQNPSAVFLNSGPNANSCSNNCSNNQEFNSYSNCSSAIPISAGVFGQATMTPCYRS